MIHPAVKRVLWAWLLIGSALLIVGLAAGEEKGLRLLGGGGGCTRPNSPVVPAVCRIVTPAGRRQSIASGTLVDVNREKGIALVLSAAHVFEETTGPPRVRFFDGFESEGKLIGTDAAGDLAAVAIWAPPGVEPVTIGDGVAKGEALRAAGWGPKGCWQTFDGPMTERASFDDGKTWEALEMRAEVRQGDSGGPILNRAGRLVGVISAGNRRFTVGCGCGLIRRFLARIFAAGRAQAQESKPETQAPAWAPVKPVAPPSTTATAPPLPSPAMPAGGAGIAERLADLAGKLQGSIEGTDALGQRLGALEALLGQVGQVPQAATLALPGWLSTLLPWLVGGGAALSGTGTLWLIVGLVVRFLRWRRQRKGGAAVSTAGGFLGGVGAVPRDTEEAFQFLRLSAMEGRSPLSDALLGRITFDELDQTIDAKPDGPQADWARRLKEKLLRRFEEMVPLSLVGKDS